MIFNCSDAICQLKVITRNLAEFFFHKPSKMNLFDECLLTL